MVSPAAFAHGCSVAKKAAPVETAIPPIENFVRQWRHFRGKTLEQLAEDTGLSTSGISQLENLKQGFTGKTLFKLAQALECHPGELLYKDPTSPENEIALLVDTMSREQQATALGILRGFLGNQPAGPARPLHQQRSSRSPSAAKG